MVTTTVVCLGELDPGSLLPRSLLVSSGRKRDALSTNRPRLLDQRVLIPHTKPKGAADAGAPVQRSPSVGSAEPKSQLASVPGKLGFFLKKFRTQIRDHTCQPSLAQK